MGKINDSVIGDQSFLVSSSQHIAASVIDAGCIYCILTERMI